MEPVLPWTLGPRARRWFDALLVLGLLGLSTLHALAGELPEAVLSGAQVALLWWRRSRPTLVFVAVAAASATQLLVTDQPIVGQLAFPVAAYSVGRWGSRWGRPVSLVVILCACLVAAWAWTSWAPTTATRVDSMVAPALACAGLAVSPWALGVAGSQRDRYVRGLVEQAEQTRRMAERDVALAAQDERARIAREMHDVVAHGLSVIVVQADGARYAAAQNPDVAVTTLGTIADTGRSSLAEMRRLLGLLRTEESGTRPQPRLDDVPHLVDEAVAAGTPVEADLPEEWPTVPEGVGLATYRVVQEALTNVRKHAGPQATVRLRVTVEREAVRVHVADDGRGAAGDPPTAPDGTGHGLVGMRERVGVHGGELDAGPAVGGGWVVDARIPL
ncbi:sensor histidine kinase [Nocardioides sp. Y6]|uniref:histidine kinase n=1 Tax=Nocardioides malaquae TaxID=2773426 RepID=A0ABR9RSQ8_9ACTN|nr:sensor histidine kinase [Nocardioides malaquae]MBE7324599.1 sensor histidine kinase [Nocardioides malaquae]